MRNGRLQLVRFTVRLLACVFIAQLLIANGCFAQKAIILRDSVSAYNVSLEFIKILKDETKSLTIEQVSTKKYDTAFYLNKKAEPYALPDAVYWIKFVTYNKTDSDNFLLQVFSHEADNVTLYWPDEHGKYHTDRLGSKVRFSNRPYNYKDLVFSLPVKNEKNVYYLRFEVDYRLNLTSVIKTDQRFTNYAINRYHWYGIVYGLFLAVILYNLIVFINIREKQYLYYVIYMVSVMLYIMCLNGTAFQFLWPEFPSINEYAFEFTNTLTFVLAMKFAQSFLHTKSYTPLFHKLLWIVIGAKVLFLCSKIFLFNEVRYFLWLDLIPLTLITISGVFAYKNGYNPARIFLIAFSLLLISYFILVSKMLQWLPMNIWAYEGLMYGIIGESILLTFALADRLRQYKMEKELALNKMLTMKESLNKELEDKVRTRTIELEQTNQVLKEQAHKIEMQATQINEMNKMLEWENEKLKEDYTHVAKSRVMLESVSFEEFKEIYPDRDACLNFLQELKWKNGFKCRKCGNSKYSAGRYPHSRRCTKCLYDESPISHTIFERLRFPIVKAFYMVFLINSKPNISAAELSRLLEVREKTCWNFKDKIMKIKESGKHKRIKHPLTKSGWERLVLT